MDHNITKPLFSVIIEGYNDSMELGTVSDTVKSLKKQTFPLDNIELILVGSKAQAANWRKTFADENSFFDIKVVGADNSNYYELKNEGARIASGQILAFADSDVMPEKTWIEAIFLSIGEQKADASAGISKFRHKNGLLSSNNPLLQAAASISWGFVLPKGDELIPNSALAHNFAIRKDIFDRYYYETDLGRLCAGSLHFTKLREEKTKMRFQPEQKTAHNFTFWWWISRLHLKLGYEVYTLRRIDSGYPNKSIARLGLLEPLTSFFWHCLLDIPQWFRFGKFSKFGLARKVSLLPLLVVMSSMARGSEMVGMYLTIFFPERMKQRAEES